MSTVESTVQPYYARRDYSGEYTYRGHKLQSVTTKLGYAPGGHLIPWAGKQAALDCCKWLVMGGVQTDDPAILDFAADVTVGSISLDDAIDSVMDWRVRMLAHERYRDHKAMIGSLGHHWIYKCALEVDGADPLRALDPKQESWTLEWLRHEAIDLNLWSKQSNPEYQPSNAQIDGLCMSAYAYVLSSSAWLLSAKPRWTMIGQEAMVVHPPVTPDDDLWTECLRRRCGISYAAYASLPGPMQQMVLDRMAQGWAGTVDGHFTLVREDYEAGGNKWVPEWGKSEATFWIDFKHSNAINHKAVQAQVSAYRACDRIVMIETGMEYELPESDFAASLHIGPHARALGVQDEFGTLESKTNQVGAKLYTYPNDPGPTEAFYGLCHWTQYSDNVPRAHQQRAKSGPKEEKIPTTVARPCPFGGS